MLQTLNVTNSSYMAKTYVTNNIYEDKTSVTNSSCMARQMLQTVTTWLSHMFANNNYSK
jgi:hypothetical protein